MAAYATLANLTTYEALTLVDPAGSALLALASRRIDDVLGPIPVLEVGTYAGMKLDPTTLKAWEAEALARATCAQASWMNTHPDSDVDELRPLKAVSGPDFTETYGDVSAGGRAPTGRYNPRVAAELGRLDHLRRLGGYVRG